MSASHAGDETLYFVTGRFSADSGGRTRSVMHRARVLSDHYRESFVLTFNDRADYGAVFAAWQVMLELPQNVRHLNFFAYLAGEPLHDDVSAPVPFEPEPDLVLSGDGKAWVRHDGDGGVGQRFVLNADGTLNHARRFADEVLVERTWYDALGRLRLRAPSDPGTSDVRRVEHLTPAGRVFVVEEIDGRRRRLCVSGGPLDTAGAFIAEAELQCAWFRELHDLADAPVFLLEDHRYDNLVVANPLLPDGARSIATVHSNHLQPGAEGIHEIKPYAKSTLDRMDRFTATVALTRQQKADIETVYGEVPTLVQIPHAIGRPRRGDAQPPLHRRVRGLVRRPPRIILVTRLHAIKRLDHVIRAFAIVAQAMPSARLEIWGAGPEELSLVGVARELGVGKQVSFCGYTSSPLAAYRRGRVSASTSSTEGFGLSTAEALACGIPVVAYDYRYGPAELIRDGVNGRLVPNGDVEALAAGLLEMLTSRRAALMGLRARLVRWTYSDRKHLARWIAVIDGTRGQEATKINARRSHQDTAATQR